MLGAPNPNKAVLFVQLLNPGIASASSLVVVPVSSRHLLEASSNILQMYIISYFGFAPQGIRN
jgi:hypothetical protein